MALHFKEAAAKPTSFLQLQRGGSRANSSIPPAFAGNKGQSITLAEEKFCKVPGCHNETDCKPVCKEQPCCCWSTFAADEHPEYPSPEETRNRQLCLYPPDDFEYAPEPGNTYDDGMM